MEHDTKVTYTVIAILIVILAGLAYFLQGAVTYPQPTTGMVSTTTQSALLEQHIRMATPKTTLQKESSNASSTMTIPDNVTKALITTNMGQIEITFGSSTPETVDNFKKFAASGFYEGTRFHRVIRDFMIQGGDPFSKEVSKKAVWGTGGPGYTFQDEIYPTDRFVQGVVAMANSGPNTNGSQFFIVTAVAGTPWLAGKHTIFAHVTKGFDIVLRIQDLQTDGSDKPLNDVIVEKVELK